MDIWCIYEHEVLTTTTIIKRSYHYRRKPYLLLYTTAFLLCHLFLHILCV